MTKNAIQWVRRGLWLVVAAFCLWSGIAAYAIYDAMQPSTHFQCGNSITGPVRLILEWGAPIVAAAVSGLGYLAYREGNRAWPVVTAGVVALGLVAGFLAVGFWFYQQFWPGHDFSRVVWWL